MCGQDKSGVDVCSEVEEWAKPYKMPQSLMDIVTSITSDKFFNRSNLLREQIKSLGFVIGPLLCLIDLFLGFFS